MKNKPFVIFIDGADGVGKSTLTQNLLHELDLHNQFAHMGDDNRKPLKFGTYDILRSTQAGTFIREAMITEELDETLRYSGFMYGVFYGLKKLFEQTDKDIIICDRSQATPYAYNICAPDMPAAIKNAQIALFDDMNKRFFAKHGFQFLNVYLQLDPKIAFERMTASREKLDVIEQRGVPFQEQVARGYESYFNKHTSVDRLLRYDTAKVSSKDTAQHIYYELKKRNAV